MTELVSDFLGIKDHTLEIQWINPQISGRPTLIFLHEGLGSLGLWKDFPRLLCQMCRCPGFIYSRLGYGESDPCILPRKINYLHKEALDVLPRVLEAADIRDHILIGHSDGGSIGLIYAGSPCSTRLKGLITEASHVFVEPVTVKSIQEAREAYLIGGLREKLDRHHGKNTDTAFWGWNDIWLHPNFIHWNIEKYLKKIQVPVMAIQGRQDPYGTLSQITALSGQIRDCRTRIIENCGHAPHMEQKEHVLKLMAGFIEDLTG